MYFLEKVWESPLWNVRHDYLALLALVPRVRPLAATNPGGDVAGPAVLAVGIAQAVDRRQVPAVVAVTSAASSAKDLLQEVGVDAGDLGQGQHIIGQKQDGEAAKDDV